MLLPKNLYAIDSGLFPGYFQPKYFGTYEDIVSLAWKLNAMSIYKIDIKNGKFTPILLHDIFKQIYLKTTDLGAFRDYINFRFEIPYYDIDNIIIPDICLF